MKYNKFNLFIDSRYSFNHSFNLEARRRDMNSLIRARQKQNVTPTRQDNDEQQGQRLGSRDYELCCLKNPDKSRFSHF